jgi:hypothetical protein
MMKMCCIFKVFFLFSPLLLSSCTEYTSKKGFVPLVTVPQDVPNTTYRRSEMEEMEKRGLKEKHEITAVSASSPF